MVWCGLQQREEEVIANENLHFIYFFFLRIIRVNCIYFYNIFKKKKKIINNNNNKKNYEVL